ncbi:MAG: FixH family protein [Nannocystaceae bacterium]|nr:FixH family protein [bacterium]
MSTDAQKETRARWFWISFILMFFAGQAVLWTFALGVVTDDPSHAVVEDYDKFATRWDETRAERSASEALGWHARLSADHERIVLELTDADGEPVDAQVQAKVFHKARAAEAQDVEFTPSGAGLSIGLANLERSGHWRVRLTATRGDDVYFHVQDVTVGQVAQR